MYLTFFDGEITIRAFQRNLLATAVAGTCRYGPQGLETQTETALLTDEAIATISLPIETAVVQQLRLGKAISRV
ncbi:MAG: hypothetical protein ACO1RT_13140, partial [Planctomycetaceae bacterium]